MKTFREHRKQINSWIKSKDKTIWHVAIACAAFISYTLFVVIVVCFESTQSDRHKSFWEWAKLFIFQISGCTVILSLVLYIIEKVIMYWGYFILMFTVTLFRYIKTICTSKKAFVDFVCTVFRTGCILSSVWITYLIGLKVLYSPNWQDDGTVLIAVPVTLINLFIGCNFKNIWRRKE